MLHAASLVHYLSVRKRASNDVKLTQATFYGLLAGGLADAKRSGRPIVPIVAYLLFAVAQVARTGM